MSLASKKSVLWIAAYACNDEACVDFKVGWTVITVTLAEAYRYKLTWEATIDDTVTWTSHPDIWPFRQETHWISAAFGGYAVIEEVPDPPSIWERNIITDFATYGHYESSRGTWDITENGMETVKRIIEMYFWVNKNAGYASMVCFRTLLREYPLDSLIQATGPSAFPTMGCPGDIGYDATTRSYYGETDVIAWEEVCWFCGHPLGPPPPPSHMYAHWVIEVEVLGVVS